MAERNFYLSSEGESRHNELPFSEFNSEHLLHLTNWTKSHEGSSRSWGLDAGNGPHDFYVHIRRDSLSGENPEVNMISIFLQKDGSHTLVVINRIERFAIKDNIESEPASQKSLFFFDSEGGSVEVRNDGEVVAFRPTRVTMNGNFTPSNIYGLNT